MILFVGFVIVSLLILLLGVASTLNFMAARRGCAFFLIALALQFIRLMAAFLMKATGNLITDSFMYQVLGGTSGFVVLCFAMLVTLVWWLVEFLRAFGEDPSGQAFNRHSFKLNRKKSREL